MGTPRVSVVMAAHNGDPWVRDALASVLGQTFTDFEVVVVDDGSTDNTAGVVSGFGPPVRVVRQDHRGVAAARNRGVAESSGELVGFLDADDLWLDEMLATLVPKFEDPATALAAADVYRWDQHSPIEQSPRRWQRRPHPDDHDDLWTAFLDDNPISTSAILVRRAALQGVGFFDETLTHASDYDMWLRVVRGGYRIRFVDRSLGVIRLHGGNMSNDWGRKYDAHVRIWNKLLALPDLTPDTRRRILRNRRTTTRARFGQAAAAYALNGQLAPARAYFLKAWSYRPFDPRNLLGLTLSWAAPGLARHAAGTGWLGRPAEMKR